MQPASPVIENDLFARIDPACTREPRAGHLNDLAAKHAIMGAEHCARTAELFALPGIQQVIFTRGDTRRITPDPFEGVWSELAMQRPLCASS